MTTAQHFQTDAAAHQSVEIEDMLERHPFQIYRDRPHHGPTPRYTHVTKAAGPSPKWTPTASSEWRPYQPPPNASKDLSSNELNPTSPKDKVHRTAYLDGLRGVAALLVYILHNQVWARIGLSQEEVLENGFGWKDHYHFATFPIIRLLFSGGHAAVPIFFVISGYVLGNKPITLVQKGELSGLAENLCSGLFRRWLRLYFPVMVTTLIWAATWHLFGIQSSLPGARMPEKTWSAELWMWYCDFKNFSFVFNDKLTFVYNHNMWTIPLEFRGSVLVWTSVLALARCSTSSRLLGEVGLVCYFLFVVDGWYLSLFMAGALLCDIDLLILSGRLPAWLSRIAKPQKWVLWLLLLCGLYFAGIPSVNREVEELREQPGWYLLSFLKPQAVWDVRNFYRSLAALLLVFCIPRIVMLKRFFESRVCQYLGKISFGLYLVHGPVLWSIGDRVYAAVGRIQPHQIGLMPGWINAFKMPGFGPFCLEVNTLSAQLILLPLTLGLAEAVTSYIDTPSVTIAQSLFHWMQDGDRARTSPLLPREKGRE